MRNGGLAKVFYQRNGDGSVSVRIGTKRVFDCVREEGRRILVFKNNQVCVKADAMELIRLLDQELHPAKKS